MNYTHLTQDERYQIAILSKAGTKFVHIQVKTFVPGSRTVSVGLKAEKNYGDNFIWVLGGIPHANQDNRFEYYVIPSPVVAENVREAHRMWLAGEGKNGHVRKDGNVRTIPQGQKIGSY